MIEDMVVLMAQGNPMDGVAAAQDVAGVYRALLLVEAALIIMFFTLWQLEVTRSRAALELANSRMRDLNSTLAGRVKDASGDEHPGNPRGPA